MRRRLATPAWRPAGRRYRLWAVTLLAVAGSLLYNRSLASGPLRLEDLPALELAGVQRVLIIAPHPDDETLGAGGLMQAALAAGAQVQVVVVTNGDGQWAAPLALHGRVPARPEDYVALGRTRQAETLRALRGLGLAPEHVRFLGYPDGSLDRLWRDDWTTACPLTAPWTRTSASPYTAGADPLDYCGRSLLRALRSVIEAFPAEAIVLPHPHDDHPDHRATAAFARLALALAQADDSSLQPAVWSYLVHHGDFPQPRGWHTQRALLPPAPLAFNGAQWRRLDLTGPQLMAKAAAVRAYPTQSRLLGSFLPSFVRRNELFELVPVTDIPRLAWAALPELGPLAWHTLPDPARESTSRLLLEGADLVELQVARAGDQVWLAARTRGGLVPGLRYQILVKTPDGHTHVLRLPAAALRPWRAGFTAELSLAELGQPSVIAIAAEVRQGATLDRTAWHLLAFDPPAEWPALVPEG